MKNVTRDNWREKVRLSGLTHAEIGARTGMSEHTIAAFSRGARIPRDVWLDRLEAALREYAREWTCSDCLVRNSADRYSCKNCARAFDGYAPGIIRPTAHGSAQ